MPECDIRRFIRERMDWIEEHRKKKGQNLPPGKYTKAGSGRQKNRNAECVLKKYCPGSYRSANRKWESTQRSGV
ncbi:MAG: hypothetical protein ACLRMZ_16415 [Blautia marasmi]